ncbi:MAG: hypothetical protein HYY93_15975 [Planctomycetes bacterium]|nr:hypothetical protein [Planctomycetota bacterium]
MVKRSSPNPTRGFEWMCLSSCLLLEASAPYLREMSPHPERPFDIQAAFLLCYTLMAGMYGLFRLGFTHPRIVPGYVDWLLQTPWSSRRPLPFGSVTLDRRDFLWVGALSLPVLFHGYLPVLPIAAFTLT